MFASELLNTPRGFRVLSLLLKILYAQSKHKNRRLDYFI